MVTAGTRTCVIALRASGPATSQHLRSDQAKQIVDMRHDQNLWKCLDEYGECDHSLLNPSEVKEVSELERQRNLLSCQTGHGLCNSQSLSSTETREASDVEHQRNILACKTGNMVIVMLRC